MQKHLGQHARVDRNTFVALNTAYFTDGAFVHVPAGQVVEKPVHLLFLSTSEERGSTSHPRNLVIAERDSRLTLIESHVSSVQGEYFTNAVTEFVIGEHAAVGIVSSRTKARRPTTSPRNR